MSLDFLDAIVSYRHIDSPSPASRFEPNAIPPCYRNSDESQVIKKDDEIRLKLIGIRVDASNLFAIGTLMDDYLGLCVTD